jgi:hypothetical protein
MRPLANAGTGTEVKDANTVAPFQRPSILGNGPYDRRI